MISDVIKLCAKLIAHNKMRVTDELAQKLLDRIAELEALCKECADHLDEDEWRSIHNDSYLHRDLKKKGEGL